MANKGTGRSKKNSTDKKPRKEPIPIDSGSSSSPITSVTGIDPPNQAIISLYPGIEEEIRRRAYELYEERGRQQGFHHEDWVRAETEVIARHRSRNKSEVKSA